MGSVSFSTYAVRLVNGKKQRYFVGAYTTEAEAKHMANCATLGNADYAYVKDFRGGTIFYLKAPDPNFFYSVDRMRQAKTRQEGQEPAT